MKIAVTYSDGEVFQHFGKTEQFKVYDVEDKKVVSSEVIGNNGLGHEALAGLLADNSIDVLICGGMGEGAKNALAEAGVEVVSGAQGDADSAVEAFLKHHKSSHTSVAILEGMNFLEVNMKVDNFFQRVQFLCVVFFQEACHAVVNEFRFACSFTAHLIGQPFVVANSKPFFAAVGSVCLQNAVQSFDHFFCQHCFRLVNNEVDATEVVHCFHNVIHVYRRTIGYSNGVGFKDIACLLMC